MAKREPSKHKIDRRLGVNLWGRPRSPFNRRAYVPGQHGPRKRPKTPSSFAMQLMAKQRLKGYYGDVSERQFRRYYREARRLRGDSAVNLIALLEQRLDAVVYHAKFTQTIFGARQLVSHGHIEVNGGRVDRPSYRVRIGDVVQLRKKEQPLDLVLEAIESDERDSPPYLEVHRKGMKVSLLRTAKLDEAPYPATMEPERVIEYYSR